MLKVHRALLFLSLSCAMSTVGAEVTVEQRVNEKTGESVTTVANNMYRVEWAQSRGRSLHCLRVLS